MPPERGGFVLTLNRKGYMRAEKDAYMEAFIAFASTCGSPVADIGAAYGVATIAALEAGATVIAVDVDARHLEILKRRVPSLDRLRTIAGCFPEGVRFDENTIGAFLLSNVVHFLSPDGLQLAARCLYDGLVPGGKVFVTTSSPYVGECSSFIPEYEARKRAGQAWPGYMTDVARYAPVVQDRFASLLLLEPDTLSGVFRQAGFVVERAELIPRPDLPPRIQWDGRETVGLIARKPS